MSIASRYAVVLVLGMVIGYGFPLAVNFFVIPRWFQVAIHPWVIGVPLGIFGGLLGIAIIEYGRRRVICHRYS